MKRMSDGKRGRRMSDLIKREDAIKAVWKPKVNPNDLIFDALKTAIESKINDIPSAERKGEWKRKIVDNGWNADFICSECGYTIMIEDTYPYCPNCGARMLKGAEAEG